MHPTVPRATPTLGWEPPLAPPTDRSRAFNAASWLIGSLAVGAAALVPAWWSTGGASRVELPWLPSWLALRADPPTAVMLVLVNFVGFVILRYSGPYLAGDARAGRYFRWMLATLASVDLLILSDNLAIVALAWVAASVSLHRLLTHFADRPAAQVAAHKKFLVSRAADVVMVVAVALVFRETGSLSIEALSAIGAASPGLQLAALLFVVTAALKSAQLPFHGWITQVMEAPTPVSALLHAGVVNIAGFVMIRLAPLMVAVPGAQALLVAIGCASAVIAGLVMTTRVSVKVMLAWSTIAQMGFMLVQCGLGAYGLALLHIVAHSLYKAHAFLSSGSAVEQWRAHQLAAPRRVVGMGTSLAAASGCIAVVAGVGAGFGARPDDEPALWALGLVLGLALTPLVSHAAGDLRRVFRGLVAATAVAVLYFGWHALFVSWLSPPVHDDPRGLRVGIVAVSFVSAFLVHAALLAWPRGAFARALQPLLFAGLYLDELFTRLTVAAWPPRRPLRPESSP